jgi:hypothetical protein
MAFLRSVVTTKTTAIAAASAVIPAAAFAFSSISPSSDSSQNLSRFLSKSSCFGSISLSSKDFLAQDRLGFAKNSLAAAKMETPSSDQNASSLVLTLFLLDNSFKKSFSFANRVS